MQIFVKKYEDNTITTLNVKRHEKILNIKRKLEEKGICSDLDLVLMKNAEDDAEDGALDDGLTLAHYGILKGSTLDLFFERFLLEVEAWRGVFCLEVNKKDSIDDVKAKIQEEMGIPSHKQLLSHGGKLLEDGSRILADYHIYNYYTLNLAIQLDLIELATRVGLGAHRQTKRARPATPTKATSIFDTCDGEATAALMPESQACPPSSVLSELEDVKREMATARNKEKELEATISRLKAENKKNEQELTIARNKEKGLEATISGLKAGNKKTDEVLTFARNKEKELEAIITQLKAENKKTKEEITIARNKEKELEATISGLMHKNKVFSYQCASYESLVDDLEVENKKTKEELMNAEKKYYAGARAAGYAEGLKEGKTKRLKFLHHLTDASMQYFNHGFDSCQKQAEQQGFCGQLNKNSALKEAPDLRGWESSDQPH